ncbi:MAG: PIN domain-containing protein [Nanoarchaeota archaeon]
MVKKYYFDTSIWLDLFEDRNEQGIPKGEWAHNLLSRIIEKNERVVLSDIVVLEFQAAGYSSNEIENLFCFIKPIIINIDATEKQLRRANDLSSKRKVPRGDALHALIARESNAILVTLDHHFMKLSDIISPQKPQDLI